MNTLPTISGTNVGIVLAGLAVVAFLAMVIAWKIGKWIAKITMLFLLLLVGAMAVWWFFLRHS